MILCKIKVEPPFFARRLLTIFRLYVTLLYCHPIQACCFSPLHHCWYGVANGPEFHWPGILKYSPQHDEVSRGLRGLKHVLLGSASSGKTPASQNCSRQHTGLRKPLAGLVSHLGIMVSLSPAAWHVRISPSKADTPTTSHLPSGGQEKDHALNFSVRRSYAHSLIQAVLSAVPQLGSRGTVLLKTLLAKPSLP